MMPTVPADRRFIISVGLGAVVVAAIPYLVGLALTPAGHLFQGNTVLAPADPNVYYSYIEQARHGALFMRDVFTSEPHQATLWQPVWLVLGWIANLFHLTTPTVFFLGRLLSVAVFVVTLWWAAGWLWPDRVARRAATLLTLGASGLGGVVVWLSGMDWDQTLQLPPDLWVAEMVPVLSSWTSPHFLFVTSGFLFVLVSVERSWQERSWRLIGWAGLVSLLTLSIHPFHALTWVALWVGLTAWRWKQSRSFPGHYACRWIAVLVMSVPALLYHAIGYTSDPIVYGRAIQNINLTPSWWAVLASLGALGALAVIGVQRMHRTKNVHTPWLIAWLVAQSVVIFLPFDGQRRLLQAMIVPFALAAVPAVLLLWQRMGRGHVHRAALIVGLVAALGTSTVVTGGRIVDDYVQEHRGRNHWEYFLSPEYQQLFTFVRGQVDHDQAILASAWDSMLLGGMTARTVLGGHPVETLRSDKKIAAMRRFYQTTNQREQATILQRYRACYVLLGPRERAYGQGFEPQQWPNLTIAWSGQTMTLYRLADCR